MPESVSQSSSASSSGMPTQIGRYIILRKLGQGGMGAVYEAEHSKLQKRVALKVLPQEVANDPAAVARFEREMLAVGRVTHPGIVQAHDADEADGIRYLAMEMVDGYDVADVAAFYEEKAGKPIPLSVACEIVRQAAVAMQAAHDAGLVHRDLKPSNLMLSVDGTVKVLDLGLAMLDAKHGDGGGLTSTGQVMGTVDYMAPEQAAETRSVDARADVYSLGATLYRLIAGKAPYPSDRFSSMLQKLMALANAEPTPLKELRSKCPDKLVALVESAMAKDPAERTATAADLAAALESAGDAKKLAELAGKMPKRKPIDPAALEATRTSALEAANQAEATGTMPGPTQPRMAVDPSVDTDHTAEATFIAQSIQEDENAPTFIGAADGSQTVITGGSPAKWERKKKPAVPKWAWGVGVAVVALLIAIPFLTQGPPKRSAASDESGSNTAALADDPKSDSRDTSRAPSVASEASKLTTSGRTALRFSRPTDKVTVEDVPLDFTQPLTIEGWFQLSEYLQLDRAKGSELRPLIDFGPLQVRFIDEEFLQFTLYVKGLDGKKYFETHSVPLSPAEITKLKSERWHFAFVFDGNTTNTYLRGQQLDPKLEPYNAKNFQPIRADRPRSDYFAGLDADAGSKNELLIGAGRDGSIGPKVFASLEGSVHAVRISQQTVYTKPFTPGNLAATASTIAIYDFHEGSGDILHDSSGNGHDGKIVGAEWVATNTPQKSNEASSRTGLLFDKRESRVEVGNLPVDLKKPITIELWCNVEDVRNPGSEVANVAVSLGPFVIKRVQFADSREFRWEFLTNPEFGGRSTLGAVTYLVNAYDIPPDKLHHVAFQVDGSSVKCFLDGTPVGIYEDAWGLEPRNRDEHFKEIVAKYPDLKLIIGSSNEKSREFRQKNFNGTIYQLSISNDLKYIGPFVPKKPAEVDPDDKTVAFYRFNQGSGDILRDSSGNGHDGKIIGAKWVVSDSGTGSARLNTDSEAASHGLSLAGRGNALRFSDAGDHVALPDMELDLSQPFTAEVWCTPDDSRPAEFHRSVPFEVGPVQLNFAKLASGNKLKCAWRSCVYRYGLGSGGGLVVAYGSEAKREEVGRTHAAIQWDGSKPSLFINGKLVPPSTDVIGTEQSVEQVWQRLLAANEKVPVRIGQPNKKAPEDETCRGMIDGFRISKGVRYTSDFEPTALTNDKQTFALYDFSEGQGDVLKDSSGNGYDGRIVGAEWVGGLTGEPSVSGPTQDFPGRLEFDGDDVVHVDSLEFDPAEPFTLEAAFSWKSVPNVTSDAVYAGRDEGPEGNQRGADAGARFGTFSHDHLSIRLGDVDVYGGSVPKTAERVHLALVHTGQELVAFRDGKLVGRESTKGKDLGPGTGRFVVGRQMVGRYEMFRLSSTARYDGDFTPQTRFATDLHTLALFNFDDGTGDILRDSSGNGHHGKIIGAKWIRTENDAVFSSTSDKSENRVIPATGVPFTGIDGYALEFNRNWTPGSSDHVVVPTLRLPKGKSYTMEMWTQTRPIREGLIRHPNLLLLGSGGRLGNSISTGADGEFELRYLDANPPGRVVATDTSLGVQQPAHVAAVLDYERQECRLFVNGRLVGRNEMTVLQDGGPFSICNQDYASQSICFKGWIDEVRLSETVRYVEDFLPQRRFESDRHTLALYHFDKGHGDILEDSSGNGHDGKIIGAEWVSTSTVEQRGNAPPLAVAPFDEAQAKAHQQAWAKYLGLAVEKEVVLPGGEKLAMMLIPPGEFLMGSGDEERARWTEVAKRTKSRFERIPHEGPQHRVRITQPFYLGKYEVTEAQWNSAMGINTPNFKNGPMHPAEQKRSDNDEVQSFLARLNASGSDENVRFALPTEAQWEYACRAGTTTAFSLGDNEGDMSQFGWFNKNAGGKTHPVGQLRPNGFQLFDMHGNVWEWCADRYAADYYAASPVDDPTGPDAGQGRVVRGGSWWYSARGCRSAIRHDSTEFLGGGLGFRVVMTVPE